MSEDLHCCFQDIVQSEIQLWLGSNSLLSHAVVWFDEINSFVSHTVVWFDEINSFVSHAVAW